MEPTPPSAQQSAQAAPDYQLEEPGLGTRFKDSLVELIQFVAIVASILMIIRVFIAEPHKVSGKSMVPNFQDGDYIITNKLATRSSAYQRGEIIILKNPQNPEKEVFIKRVIGLPGETLKLSDGKVYINETLLNEPYLPQDLETHGEGFLKDGDEITMPADNYFVMGDNRKNSSDSRQFGLIPKSEIIGQAFLRYWPVDKMVIIPIGTSTN
ncbi:MAG: signal peptidase I [Microgenomates group bacterium]|jgi:signal peptidase I